MRKVFLAIVILLAVVPAICFAAATNSFKDFKAEDYNGNEVTADIFKNYDVTMVNVFTTWCGYCIREMPDIEKLSRNLPEKANLIGICADAYEAPDDLKDIVDEFGLDFTIVKMLAEDFFKIYNLIGYPTTVFVDKNGKIIGELVGAHSYSDYSKKISTLLKRK